jgi:hypothetical protein
MSRARAILNVFPHWHVTNKLMMSMNKSRLNYLLRVDNFTLRQGQTLTSVVMYSL